MRPRTPARPRRYGGGTTTPTRRPTGARRAALGLGAGAGGRSALGAERARAHRRSPGRRLRAVLAAAPGVLDTRAGARPAPRTPPPRAARPPARRGPTRGGPRRPVRPRWSASAP